MALGGFCVAMLGQGHHGRVAARVPRRFRAAAFRPVPKLHVAHKAERLRMGRLEGNEHDPRLRRGQGALLPRPVDLGQLGRNFHEGRFLHDGLVERGLAGKQIQIRRDKSVPARPDGPRDRGRRQVVRHRRQRLCACRHPVQQSHDVLRK